MSACDAGERVAIMAEQRMAGNNVWSIVLAGGEGERLKPFVLRWLGRHRPKQYCTFVGTRSMFEHTLNRAALIASPKRTVVVAARHHGSELRNQLFAHLTHKTIEQPVNRDTASGIFLPLSYVRARDPQAMVVVQPSDHFVCPERRFVETVRQSVVSAEAMPDRLLLLGVQPDRLETEYGWIQRGARLNGTSTHPIHAVSSFVEKPGLAQADAILRSGGLWNTLVLTATVDALWKAGWACFPDLMVLFERLCAAWGTPDEAGVLEDVYREMPQYNFSSHLLQRVPDRVAVMELTGVLWSDWGKPERIAESIRRIGKVPAFPLDCLGRPFTPNPIPQKAEEILVPA
jgi:mannose-1-phosphate guanylyltransferase